MKKNRYAFTLVELLIVMAIISLLAALLLPALEDALENARYARWRGFANQKQLDPDLVAHYIFEEKEGTTLRNWAMGAEEVGIPAENLDGKFIQLTGWNHPQWVSGRWGPKGGLYFCGDKVGIDCGNSRAFQITDAFTIEASFRTIQYRPSSMQQWIIGFDYSNTYNGWNFVNDGRYLWKAQMYSSSGITGSNWSVADAPFEWVHAVITWDGEKYWFYHNGKRVRGPTNWAGPIKYTNDPAQHCKIGILQWSNTAYFHGIIDEIAIYRRALSAEEVKGCYEMGRVR